MKQRLKQWLFRLLGKDPEAVVVTFCTGDPELCRRMVEEVRSLVPDRRHFTVTQDNWPKMRRELKRYRIGLAPVLLTGESNALRRAAYRLAPGRILAYNSRLERHHLRFDLTSLLFYCGVPLGRVHLRPRWWPMERREKTVVPKTYHRHDGRPRTAGRGRVAVLSPYLPYPLSHGGAVRIFHLLREIAGEFDVELFAFADRSKAQEIDPLLEFCSRVVVVQQPDYRDPKWSTLLPHEVHEFRSAAMRFAIDEERLAFGFRALQVEYTQLAEYGGDILVEHDVTFDLFGQVHRRTPSLSSWWNYTRWRRFERRALEKYKRVVVMSKKDLELVAPTSAMVIENGVDFTRFRATPEPAGQHLLFIGSFRHFPNVEAFRFFQEQVWPLLRDRFPQLTATVVGGPDHLSYWRTFTDSPEPPADPRIELLDFVADVRPCYERANIVMVPTTVSAGTNVKVLEAMAMRRAVVSTSSGCAGLGLLHGKSVWIGDTAEDFAAGVTTLLGDPERRTQIAAAAYDHARRSFDWEHLGEKQRALLRSFFE